MNDDTRDIRDEIDERAGAAPKGEALGSLKVMGEQTLAVDLARAEVDQQIATAHKYPRNLDVVVKKIAQLSSYDEAAADNSVYALPRAGKAIVGPSIGFANIVASCWGNCRDGSRITYIDRREKVLYAEGVFHDLETNRLTILPVNRRIADGKGRLYNDDMIMVTGMAAASIARRNAILNAVSRPIWFPYYERALFIVRGTKEQLPDRRAKALKELAHFGVDPKQVLLYLGIAKIEEIDVEHMPTLRGMFVQLRDGAITAQEMFDPRKMRGVAFDQIDNPLGDDGGDDEPAGEQEASRGPAAPQARVSPGAAGATGNGSPAATARPAPEEARERGETGEAPEARGAPAREPAPAAQVARPAPEKQAAPAKVETADQYIEYALAWIEQLTSKSAINERFGAERKIRNNLRIPLDEGELADLKKAKDARIAVLEGGSR